MNHVKDWVAAYDELGADGLKHAPMESWHGILKKETLYNNNIASLEHYIQLVEEWIAFYNSTRLKNRNLK
jgi:transposase InsO family protein